MSEPGSAEGTQDDAALRSARRVVALFAVALLAVSVAAVVLIVDRGDGGGVPGETSGPSTITDLGARPGQPLPVYVAERRAALHSIEGRRGALVSLADYVTEDELSERLGDEVDVLAILVAVPGDLPRLARRAKTARHEAVVEAESQIEEIASLVPTVEDPEFAAFYRAELLRYRRIVDAADRDDVVFGAVVVARVADLRALASRPGIRLVDVGESAEFARGARLAGVRPEESVSAGEPSVRP